MMKNYYTNEPTKYIKTGGYERNCYEFYLSQFDLVFVYTKFIQESYAWMGFCVFGLHSIAVPEDYLDDMIAFCQTNGVLVYTEKQLNDRK